MKKIEIYKENTEMETIATFEESQLIEALEMFHKLTDWANRFDEDLTAAWTEAIEVGHVGIGAAGYTIEMYEPGE
jgi:hypothetical protein